MLRRLFDKLFAGKRRRENFFVIETQSQMSSFEIQRLEYFKEKYSRL